jgi:hypothetical protein
MSSSRTTTRRSKEKEIQQIKVTGKNQHDIHGKKNADMKEVGDATILIVLLLCY